MITTKSRDESKSQSIPGSDCQPSPGQGHRDPNYEQHHDSPSIESNGSSTHPDEISATTNGCLRDSIIYSWNGRDRVGVFHQITDFIHKQGDQFNIRYSHTYAQGKGAYGSLEITGETPEELRILDESLRRHEKFMGPPDESMPPTGEYSEASLVIIGADRSGMANEITGIMTKHGIDIRSCTTATRPPKNADSIQALAQSGGLQEPMPSLLGVIDCIYRFFNPRQHRDFQREMIEYAKSQHWWIQIEPRPLPTANDPPADFGRPRPKPRTNRLN